MEKLHQVRMDPQWDLIVLDTPPTQNALDFLDAPERLIDAIDSPATRWFVQAFQSSAKGTFSILGKGASLVFKGLSRFTGAEFLERVAEFIAGLNDMFGGFRERAGQVAKALRSPDVGFVVVTSPSPMAIREARFFSDRLREAEMKRDGVIVNQVHPTYAAATPPVERIEAVLGDHVTHDLARRIAIALDDERRRGEMDRREADALRAHVGTEAAFVEVPAFETDVHDLRALARVASHLVGQDLLA